MAAANRQGKMVSSLPGRSNRDLREDAHRN